MNKNKLEIVYINAKDLQLLEGNPRRLRDPEGIKKLKTLIKEHGFQNPLQVYKENDGKFTILCGNYRFIAAQELGTDSFPCTVYEGGRNMALARAVSDNKSGEWTEFDPMKLLDTLQEIDVKDIELPPLTGLAELEIKDIMEGPDFRPIKAEDMGRLDVKDPVKCPECGHEFTP